MSGQTPDPEVPEKPKRRQFSAEYKRRILAEADATPQGGIGTLLRREGLYYSHLVDWRNQQAKGTLGTARVGRPAKDRRDVELEALRIENEALRRRVEQAEAVIDVQKTLSAAWDRLCPRRPGEETGHDRRRPKSSPAPSAPRRPATRLSTLR